MSKGKCIGELRRKINNHRSITKNPPSEKNNRQQKKDFNHNGHTLKNMTSVVIDYNPLWVDTEGKRQEMF